MSVAQTSLLGVALLISVLTDLKWRRIFDWVTWPAMLVLVALHFVSEGVGGWFHGAVSGLLGALVSALPFAVLAWRGKMGWGDAKLMGVVGAALGLPLAVAGVVFVSFAGAVQALGVLALGGRATGKLPYAVAIAVGAACTLWWSRSGMGVAG